MPDDAREPVRFVPLLAGNLVAVGLLAVAFCAQFQGPVPLWLLQAPYFLSGVVAALVLTPVEMLLLNRPRPHVPNVAIEAVLTAAASTLVGIPGGLLIGLIGALGPRSFVGADLAGVGGYIVVGGFAVAAACFICSLVGRLLAALLGRAAWIPYAILGLAIADIGLAIVYLVVT